MILLLIFSYEALKYQQVSVYIMKGQSFDFPKTQQLLLVTPSIAFFLTPKISHERDPFKSCHHT